MPQEKHRGAFSTSLSFLLYGSLSRPQHTEQSGDSPARTTHSLPRAMPAETLKTRRRSPSPLARFFRSLGKKSHHDDAPHVPDSPLPPTEHTHTHTPDAVMAQAPSTFPRGVHDTQDGVSDGAEALTLPLKPSTFPRALDVPTIMVTPAESFDTLPRPRRHATFGPRASSDLDFHYPTLDRRPRPPILRLPPSDVSSHTSSQSLQPSHPAADLHLIDLISLQKDSPCTTPSTPDVDLSAITDPSILLSLLAKTSIFVPDARAPILHRLADLVLLAKSNPSEARLPDGETYRSTMRVLWSARRMSKFRRSEWDELMERIEAADEEDAGSDATVSDGGGDGDGDGADTEAHAEGEHGHGHGHGRGVGEGEAEDEVRSEAAKSTSTDATRAMHVDLASHDSTGGTYPRTGMATATTTRRGYLSLSSLLGRKK